MTDQEIIAALQAKATAIMRDKSLVTTDTIDQRADQLEKAHAYLICCAILAGEFSYDRLKSFSRLTGGA